MSAALRNYHSRMQRVLDHIDRHLDDNLDLETVSGIAAFSKFHFHRQFTATFGLSVHRYVQLARMKRASYRLAYRDAQSVTEVAMDAGYVAPDARSARAFRQRFGQSPSSFRKDPDWEPWLAAFGPLEEARSKIMQRTFTADDVVIRDVPSMQVAIMEHRGDPAALGATIQRFIAWRKSAGFHPGRTRPSTYGGPNAVPRRRPTIALTSASGPTNRSRQTASRSGSVKSLADVARCYGSLATPTTWRLQRSTYIASGFLPAARRHGISHFYCQRLAFFPEVPEHEAIAELFLPLK
ncbi:AraC family transcriptional regulator [Methylobacterium oryzae CBMB20]